MVGRGVSYCATCDGMLYRGRRAVVTGDAADLAEEAAFLQEIGVLTTVITARAVSGLPEGMEAMTASAIALQGRRPYRRCGSGRGGSSPAMWCLSCAR